jgi:TolB-like protein
MLKKRLTAFAILVTVCLLCSASSPQHVPTLIILPFQAKAGSDLDYIAEGLATLLPSRISIPGKINVVDMQTLKKALRPHSPSSREHTIEVARRLNADFILEGTLSKNTGSINVDARVFEVTDQKNFSPVSMQVTEIDALIPETGIMAETVKKFILRSTNQEMQAAKLDVIDMQAQAPAAVTAPELPQVSRIQEETLTESDLPSPALQPRKTINAAPVFEKEPFMSRVLRSTAMQTLIAADIDADGTREFVLATADTIYGYSLHGTILEKMYEIKTGVSEYIVDISAADLNGNGVEELYVSCYEGRFANSFVLEKSAGGFSRPAENLQWFFRVYEHPRNGRILLGQKADSGNPFQGEIRQFVWQDAALSPREKISLPEGLGIYAFTQADLADDGRTPYVGFYKTLFSQSHQLAIYNAEDRISWRDRLDLGGSPRTFVRHVDRENIDSTEAIPMRIFCEDIDRDGSIDILVAKNTRKAGRVLGSFGDFHEGTLLCLKWDGLDMVPNWSSPILNTYITDYTLADMDNDGSRELYILSVAFEGLFGRATNTLTGFRLDR